MFMGLTIANIVGVPLATWAGEHMGWRAAFWRISALGVTTMVALRSTLPCCRHPRAAARWRNCAYWRGPVSSARSGSPPSARPQCSPSSRTLPDPARADPWLARLCHHHAHTHWRRTERRQRFGGLFADRSADRTLVVTLAGLSLILVALALLMPFTAPTVLLVFLWSVASFALVPPLQVRVMQTAADAPNLASAINVGAFNLGNAIGGAVGGGVIAAGMGYPAVALAGAAAAALGLLAVLLSIRCQA